MAFVVVREITALIRQPRTIGRIRLGQKMQHDRPGATERVIKPLPGDGTIRLTRNRHRLRSRYFCFSGGYRVCGLIHIHSAHRQNRRCRRPQPRHAQLGRRRARQTGGCADFQRGGYRRKRSGRSLGLSGKFTEDHQSHHQCPFAQAVSRQLLLQ